MLSTTDATAEAELKAAGGGPLSTQLSLESEEQRSLRLKPQQKADEAEDKSLDKE